MMNNNNNSSPLITVVAGKVYGNFFAAYSYAEIGNILNNHPNLYPDNCLVVKIGNDDDDFELITGLDEEDIIKAFRLSTFTSEKGIRSKFRL